MMNNKKGYKLLVLATTSLLSVALCIVFSSGRSLGYNYGQWTNAGSCYDNNAAMVASIDDVHGCFISGVGWLRYKFTDDFRSGLAIYSDTKALVKDGSGNAVKMSSITSNKYNDKNVELLKLDQIYFGPGSVGNGDWQQYKQDYDGDNADSCRTNGEGIYRSGYFEGKTNAFTSHYDGHSDASPTSDGSSVARPIIGITGHQALYESSVDSRTPVNDCLAYVGNANGHNIGENPNCAHYMYQVVDYINHVNAYTPGAYDLLNTDAYNWYSGFGDYRGILDYADKNRKISIKQYIQYDGVTIAESDSAFNYFDKGLAREYAEGRIASAGLDGSLTADTVLTILVGSSNTESKYIINKTNGYKNRNDYKGLSSEAKSVVDDVWRNYQTHFAWCYHYNSAPKEDSYNADIKIKVDGNGNGYDNPANGDPDGTSTTDNPIPTVQLAYNKDKFKVKYTVYNVSGGTQVDQKYSVDYDDGSNTATEQGSFPKGADFFDGEVSIDPGATITLCGTLKYNSKYENGNFSGSTNKKACIKVYRPKYAAEIIGQTAAFIQYPNRLENGAIKGGSDAWSGSKCKRQTSTNGNWRNYYIQPNQNGYGESQQGINYSYTCEVDLSYHQQTPVRFQDRFKIAGASNLSGYNKDKNGDFQYYPFAVNSAIASCNVDSSIDDCATMAGSRNHNVSQNEGSANNGWNLAASGSGQYSTTSSYYTSFIEALWPQQEGSTKKHLVNYKQTITTDGKNEKDGIASVTVTLKRAPFTCTGELSNKKFGYYTGENTAALTGEVVGVGSNKKITLKDASVGTEWGTFWTKPGEKVRFDYDLCAGASYAARLRETYFPGSETFRFNSSRPFYLFGDSIQEDDKQDTSVSISPGQTGDFGKNTLTGAEYNNRNFFNISSSNTNTWKNDQSYFATTVKSPNDYSRGHYDCDGSSINGLAYGSKTYCISGGIYDPFNNKNSIADAYQRETMQTDVGDSFVQSIDYNYIKFDDGDTLENASAKKMLTVSTPYNYKIEPNVESDSGMTLPTAGSVYQGSAHVGVSSRQNDVVGGNYKTVSKRSKVVVLGFITDASEGQIRNAVNYVDLGNDNVDIRDICEASLQGGAVFVPDTCKNASDDSSHTTAISSDQVDNSSDLVAYENTVYNATTSGDVGSGAIRAKYTIPNSGIEIGQKVCLVTAVWPADSHNDPFDNSLDSESKQNNALGQNYDGAKWAVSAPSCNTVSKQPTFSVEGGSLFTTGDISVSTPTISDGGNKYRAGSWVEYGIMLGGGSNNGLASGAGYGYKSHTINGTNDKLFGSLNEPFDSDFRSDMYTAEINGATNKCQFASQTIRNEDCDAAAFGGYGSSASSEVVDVTIDRLAREKDNLKALFKDRNLDGGYGKASGAQVSQDNSDCIDYAHSSDHSNKYYCLPSGETYFDFGSDNVTLEEFTAMSHSNPDLKNTIVIKTENNVTIKNNITFDRSSFSGINNVPQIIIFAKNVFVYSDVTEINAWIIAEDTFNSCYHDSGSGKTNIKVEDLGVGICDKPLVVNGPVSAKNIVLNRTAGGGTPVSYSSSNPDLNISPEYYGVRGEIFNLTNATYYWLESQLESASGLTTTYIRELPARF